MALEHLFHIIQEKEKNTERKMHENWIHRKSMVECVALNVCCQEVSFDYNKLKRITSNIYMLFSVSVSVCMENLPELLFYCMRRNF